jgi:transposase-like protein
MAQHFLLSKQARTLSLKAIYKAGEDQAYRRRSARCVGRRPAAKPVCPRCECTEAYGITTRRKFKCKACHHQFSVTSGTIFASRKMAFRHSRRHLHHRERLKGLSISSFPAIWTCQYKTAFVLAHKLREAMAQDVHTGEVLAGDVEMDGAYSVATSARKTCKEERVDRRRRKPDRPAPRRDRACVSVLDGRYPSVRHPAGSRRRGAGENVSRPPWHVGADEASHWDDLHNGWVVERVNHSLHYSDHGKHTNWSKASSRACAAWCRASTTT